MSTRKAAAVMVAALAVSWTAVAAERTAPPASAGQTTVYVLSDRKTGTEGLADKQIQQRNQVFDWMETDMLTLLRKRGGYQSEVLQSRDAFKPGPGKYLLVTRIVKYNPGAKAARMFVGFGAGATSLDTHYELYGEGREPLLSTPHGVGSSREWMNCCRKLNEQMLEAINAKLGGAPAAK